MAGESLIIGYRADDPRRYLTEEYRMGWWTQPDGRCIECGKHVYLNNSGRRAHRERDSALLCRFDYEGGKRNRAEILSMI